MTDLGGQGPKDLSDVRQLGTVSRVLLPSGFCSEGLAGASRPDTGQARHGMVSPFPGQKLVQQEGLRPAAPAACMHRQHTP